MSEGSSAATTSNIHVSEDDVYVAGTKFSEESGNPLAIYWKNGTMFYLSDGRYWAEAYEIFVVINKSYMYF